MQADRFDQISERAAELYRKAVVLDGEGVALLIPTAGIAQPPYKGRSFLDRAMASGVTAMNTSLGIEGMAIGPDSFRALLMTMYGYLRYFKLHPDKVMHIETVADIERAKAEQKLGIIFGVQGLAAKIDEDTTLLRIAHKMGLRVAQLTHNKKNAFGHGCLETPDLGLTQLGRECIMESNVLGIVADLAHAGHRTAVEAIDQSTKPCLISHGNAWRLNPNPRNATDDMLDALARNGGVIGVSAWSPFCETKPRTRPSLADWIIHVKYIADRIGVRHVGIGSDFWEAEPDIRFMTNQRFYKKAISGYSRGAVTTIYTEGFERIEHFPRVAEALLSAGFSDEETLGVLGGNMLRVFREVWR